MFERESALQGPEPDQPRPDFTAHEVLSGKNLFFMQKDNLSSNSPVYRMNVRRWGPDGFVVEIENVTPIWFYVVQLSRAHVAHSIYFLKQSAPGTWDYFSTMEAGSVPSMFETRYKKSLINRAIALYRHVAGIPTDQDPPRAP